MYSLSLWLPLAVFWAPVSLFGVPGAASGSKFGASMFESKRFERTKRPHVMETSVSLTESVLFKVANLNDEREGFERGL